MIRGSPEAVSKGNLDPVGHDTLGCPTSTQTMTGPGSPTRTMTGTPTSTTDPGTSPVIGTPGLDTRESLDIRFESYNCHGFNSSCFYIKDRLKNCDFMCLTETWLRPTNLNCINNVVNDSQNNNFLVFAKSSMSDCDPNLPGRPYGGVAIIARKNNMFTMREIVVPNDRIICLGLYDCNNVLTHVLVCTYLPFFDKGNAHQTYIYTECIDSLQTIIDNFGANCAITILGDFNAQLPMNTKLNRLWYKSKGFTRHSCILYDFAVSNNMLAADLLYNKPDSYTYYCHGNGNYTWIDHALCFNHMVENLKECVIVAEHPDNVSDHLPIRIVQTVLFNNHKSYNKQTLDSHVTTPATWSNHLHNDNYRSLLELKLKELPLLDSVNTGSDVQEIIDKRLSSVNEAIHSAASEAGCVPRKKFRSKPYWCPELSQLRDKKRFWWTIWVNCGRPKQGTVFEIKKYLKKQFRQLSRRAIRNLAGRDISQLNCYFTAGNMKAFWNKLKRVQQNHVDSHLSPTKLADHYRRIMTDCATLDASQKQITELVQSKAKDFSHNLSPIKITQESLQFIIKKLRRDVAPGLDGVTAEHLQHGLSLSLLTVLANVFSLALSNAIVPSLFMSGIIVPVIKKSTCDPNLPSSYRPITLSSIYCKIVELIIIPEDIASDIQFGFRKKRGTTMVTCMINDLSAYFISKGSPLYISSLDAEKCFDNIWHAGLMFKLLDVFIPSTWLFLHKWYKSSSACVIWNGQLSQPFSISKGMRQGSVLSPVLFNLFINDLLEDLRTTGSGASVLDKHFTACAYADDITVFSATAPGLQRLIDKCDNYAKAWRFNFGIQKSHCMIIGKPLLKNQPQWYLSTHCMTIANSLDILGVTMNNKGTYTEHVEKRISVCRRSMFRYAPAGMCYPGLHTKAKSYIWRSTGAPTLMYGMDSVYLNRNDLRLLKTTQGTTLKHVMGFGKRSRHTALTQAMNIKPIEVLLKEASSSLFRRISQVNSPARDLQAVLLSLYCAQGCRIKRTLIDRLLSFNISPMLSFYSPIPKCNESDHNDGLVDTLRFLICHDNFIKSSDEHFLASLLTKAF